MGLFDFNSQLRQERSLKKATQQADESLQLQRETLAVLGEIRDHLAHLSRLGQE